jgi:hypothetical protein
VFVCQRSGQGDPARAWELISRPQEWSSWAPHVRGAWGLGQGEVRVGARGYARLLGVVPIPATITAVDPGRSWTWQVGPVEMVHRVDRAAEGCTVAVEISAPAPIEAALRIGYRPLVDLLLSRLLSESNKPLRVV